MANNTITLSVIITALALTGCMAETGKDSCTQLSDEKISEIYNSSMQCMGLYAEPPETVFVDFTEIFFPATWAMYYSAAKTVYINTGEMGLGFEHSCRTQKEALQHENIHHILSENGMSSESRSHASVFFEPCGLGVAVNN